MGPDIARDWISDSVIAKQVSSALAEYQLDGPVILADAIRQASYELEPIESMIVSLQARRDKALTRIAQYRGDFGALLRESSSRLIDGEVLELEHVANKKQSNAAPDHGERGGQPPNRAKEYRSPL